MRQFKDSRNTQNGILIQSTSNRNINIKTKRKIIKSNFKKWEEKQQYGHFNRLTVEILHEMAWTWLSRGILLPKIESFLIAQNNAKWTKLTE